MRIYTLTCELLTSASIEEAFAMFQDPYNLARITPPWLHFQILTANLEMRVDARIEYRFRWFVFPMRWKTRIVRHEPPKVFVDEAERSPYALWHHEHEFRATPKGTIVSDRVTYAVPYGPLGRLLHEVAIAKQLKAIFNYRQQEIGELLGGNAVQLREPSITG